MRSDTTNSLLSDHLSTQNLKPRHIENFIPSHSVRQYPSILLVIFSMLHMPVPLLSSSVSYCLHMFDRFSYRLSAVLSDTISILYDRSADFKRNLPIYCQKSQHIRKTPAVQASPPDPPVSLSVLQVQKLRTSLYICAATLSNQILIILNKLFYNQSCSTAYLRKKTSRRMLSILHKS